LSHQVEYALQIFFFTVYRFGSSLDGRHEVQRRIVRIGGKNRAKTKNNGDAGYRSPYLSHAKRALYHLSYIPCWAIQILRLFIPYHLWLLGTALLFTSRRLVNTPSECSWGTGSTERLLMSSMLDPHEGSPSAIMQAWTCKSESNNAAVPRWNRPASCNKTPHACPSFPWMMQIAEQASKKTPAYAYCIFQTQNGPAQIK
jgi:hypothetical protein